MLRKLLANKSKIESSGAKIICPIWGNLQGNSCFYLSNGEWHYYWSSRAGGAFAFSETVNLNPSEYIKDNLAKKALSRKIFEQNIKGNIPKFTSSSLKVFDKSEPISIDEKLSKTLEVHSILVSSIPKGMFVSGPTPPNYYDIKNLAIASTETDDSAEFLWLCTAAEEAGELKSILGHRHLTPKGLKKIQTITRASNSSQAFIAMWFSSSMDSPYQNAIAPAVKNAGYKAYRVDEDQTHTDQITNKILAEIKNSKFLIADFTHDEGGARGGVYFEAGYAMGLGIPVIWAIRKDDISSMHFDTNHYPHIVWEDEDQLRDRLENAIIAHQNIGRGPL